MDIKQSVIKFSETKPLIECQKINTDKNTQPQIQQFLDDKPVLQIKNGNFYVIKQKSYF